MRLVGCGFDPQLAHAKEYIQGWTWGVGSHNDSRLSPLGDDGSNAEHKFQSVRLYIRI